MILLLHPDASDSELDEVMRLAGTGAARPPQVRRSGRVTFVHLPDGPAPSLDTLRAHPRVTCVVDGEPTHLLASRRVHPDDSVVTVGDVEIGGTRLVLAAGPCSVEDREVLRRSAGAAREAGARLLRGGAYKPRTSPYAFQGLGEEGLELLADVGRETGLAVVTEALAPDHVELVSAHADMIQIGSRNMQNFPLLAEVGRQQRPVLLKRGMMATLDEFLGAAEYVLTQGNDRVVLCERGIRTFETRTRNTLDVAAIPLLKGMTHLPVIADPSHATGRADLVAPCAWAAVAAGADGLLVEVHPAPGEARSDGEQALLPEQLVGLARGAAAVAGSLGRSF